MVIEKAGNLSRVFQRQKVGDISVTHNLSLATFRIGRKHEIIIYETKTSRDSYRNYFFDSPHLKTCKELNQSQVLRILVLKRMHVNPKNRFFQQNGFFDRRCCAERSERSNLTSEIAEPRFAGTRNDEKMCHFPIQNSAKMTSRRSSE